MKVPQEKAAPAAYRDLPAGGKSQGAGRERLPDLRDDGARIVLLRPDRHRCRLGDGELVRAANGRGGDRGHRLARATRTARPGWMWRPLWAESSCQVGAR